MRVTTDFWVAALLKRVFSAGGFAAIVSRGSPEAGAVHVITRDRFGEVALYAPAPQTSYDDAKPDERHFVRLDIANDAVEARLERERRFDPDIWIVEVEPGSDPIEALISIKP